MAEHKTSIFQVPISDVIVKLKFDIQFLGVSEVKYTGITQGEGLTLFCHLASASFLDRNSKQCNIYRWIRVLMTIVAIYTMLRLTDIFKLIMLSRV
jgi:hypothetical protein